jgi:1,2-diacylglycerol 3-beta-galactosyltransferase
MTHILFLMSDTGGGHRAAARAIEFALNERYPGQFTSELVDCWKDYTPFPLSTMPDVYTPWINYGQPSYSALFWLNDHLISAGNSSRLFARQMYPRMKKLYTEHPADIVVCVHSVFVRPAVYALRRMKLQAPFITVITDYAWPTVLWYDKQVDRCLTPTEPAHERGFRLGLREKQLRLTGAPVHPKFTKVKLTREEAKRQLGWSTDRPAVLMVGGGAGMGPLIRTARLIDEQKLPIQLVVVAGRNDSMKARLEAYSWHDRKHVHLYGFVDNMEVLMTAADLLITKAGPATITEAAIVGLPMVISGAIPFQESPNTQYVVKKGAALHAPGPRRVAETVAEIFSDDGTRLREMAASVKRIAKPEAIWDIADEIHAYHRPTP